MMTLCHGKLGDAKLYVKGSLDTLFYQCSAFIDASGERQMMNEKSRAKIRAALSNCAEEQSVPICICYKDMTREELSPSDMFTDSGG